MRNKKPFLFDEKAGAEKIIRTGFPDGKIDYATMYSVAKFYRQEFGYGEIRLERELIRFCQESDRTFNPVLEAESIKKWIKVAMNYGLRKVDEIKVSSEELAFLKTIENPKDRKILFITLILARAIKQSNVRLKKKYTTVPVGYFIRYSNFSDVIRLSKINNLSETGLADIFHKYKDYFTFYNPERELIRLNYATLYSQTWTILKNLENINNDYIFLFGGNKAICTRCGAEIVKKSNRQAVCGKCAREVRSIQARARKEKWKIKQSKLKNAEYM